jgi:hypothetical protein
MLRGFPYLASNAATMQNELQVNVRLPAKLVQQIDFDKARNRTTKEIILTAALADFFKSWSADERSKFYKKHQPYSRRGAEVQ